MSGFPVNHFNWLPRPSFLESSAAWRARQQAFRQDFEANTSAVWSTFTQTNADFATGMSSIAASTAVKRLQDAADAKNAQNAADAQNAVDLSV
jgi:hypothetical protein